MKFGKYLQENISPDWKDYYVDYHFLKKYLKSLTSDNTSIVTTESPTTNRLTLNFQENILQELNKVVAFINKQKTKNLSKLSTLNEKLHNLLHWMESGFPDLHGQALKLKSEFIEFGIQVRKLLFYAELNMIAIRKILKKHDKLLGQQMGKSLVNQFEHTRLRHLGDVAVFKTMVNEVIQGTQKVKEIVKSTELYDKGIRRVKSRSLHWKRGLKRVESEDILLT
eukprot:snap_masked-scaffold_3-processed-gene-16.56-mRNA-1 protein AED:1.00 eAED:1.00 QI:0/-1/0/0/-1/1/1/0/223